MQRLAKHLLNFTTFDDMNTPRAFEEEDLDNPYQSEGADEVEGEDGVPPVPNGLIMAGRFPEEEVATLSNEELQTALDELENRWRVGHCKSPADAFTCLVSRVYDLNALSACPSMEQRNAMLEERTKSLFAEIVLLQNVFACRWTQSAEMRSCTARAARLVKLAYMAHDAASAMSCIHGISRPEGAMEDDDDFLRFGAVRPSVDLMPDKLTDYAQLVLFTVMCAFRDGHFKFGSDIYKRVIAPDGHRTQAFKHHMSIAEYISEMANPVTHANMYAITISRGNIVNDVAKTIAQTSDDRLPVLRRVRNIWSFPNGTYVGSERQFFLNGTDHPWRRYAATRYIDIPFDPSIIEMDPEAIPTPNVETILDSQNFDPEIKLWAYILVFGRPQYEITEHDNWELAPFLKGVGASGKSSLLHQAARMFDASDVGVIGSDPDKYVTASLVNKLLAVCYEASKSIGMNQMDFQSSVTGEEMSIRDMFRLAVTREWRTPILLAGNLSPGWTDNSGSFARRIALFHFTKRPKANPSLKRNLLKDLPNLIHKANALYRNMVARLTLDDAGEPLEKPVDVWDAMPATFMMNRENLAKETNPLEAFLSSGTVVKAPNLYIDEDTFSSKFFEHCRTRRSGRKNDSVEWNPDMYMPVFDNNGITMCDDARSDPITGKHEQKRWIVGLTIQGYGNMGDAA